MLRDGLRRLVARVRHARPSGPVVDTINRNSRECSRSRARRIVAARVERRAASASLPTHRGCVVHDYERSPGLQFVNDRSMPSALQQSTANNARFWDELCGSALARSLGIADASRESLSRFDRAYLDLYP